MNPEFFVSQHAVPTEAKPDVPASKSLNNIDLKSVTHWHLDRTSKKLEKSFQKNFSFYAKIPPIRKFPKIIRFIGNLRISCFAKILAIILQNFRTFSFTKLSIRIGFLTKWRIRCGKNSHFMWKYIFSQKILPFLYSVRRKKSVYWELLHFLFRKNVGNFFCKILEHFLLQSSPLF